MIDESGPPLYALTCTTCGSVISLLSHRQMQVYEGICKGKSNREIARDTGMTYKTTKNTVSDMFRSLDLSSRLQVIHYSTFHDVQEMPKSTS